MKNKIKKNLTKQSVLSVLGAIFGIGSIVIELFQTSDDEEMAQRAADIVMERLENKTNLKGETK